MGHSYLPDVSVLSTFECYSFPTVTLPSPLFYLSLLVKGLTTSQANLRLAISGPNILEVTYVPTFMAVFLDEIYEPTQMLLITVGVLYALIGSLEEAITALIIIVLMAMVREDKSQHRTIGRPKYCTCMAYRPGDA